MAAALPWLFLLICLAISLHYSRIGWENPLTDDWRFRETQTAWPVRTFLENGFRLDYETPVLGAPWSIPFEFPTYQACVALLVKFGGLPIEPAGRTVSLFFGYGSFALIGLLVAQAGESRAAGIFSSALCLVSPVYLFGSRAFVIESTALFFTLGLLCATHAFLRRPRFLPLIIMLLAGGLAGLTKATTYCVGLLGVAGLIALQARQAWVAIRATVSQRRLLIAFVLALAVPFLLTIAWIHFTDAVKSENDLAAFITSEALREWNFGTWKQRLSFPSWEQLAVWINYGILGTPITWLAGLAVALEGGVRKGLAFVFFVLFVGGFVVFTNLYVVHEYYHYATGVYLLAILGLALGAWWDRGTIGSRCGTVLAASVMAALMVWGYVHRNLPQQVNVDTSLVDLARGIQQVAPPGSAILVYGHEWDSTLSFYADRRAIMERNNLAPDDPKIQAALTRLDRPLGAVVIGSFFRDDWKFVLPQLRGLGVGRQRVFSSRAGDVYRASDAPGLQSAAWLRAGFAESPGMFESALEVSETVFAGRPAMLVHAPGVLVVERGGLIRSRVRFGFGIRENAYGTSSPTDGVTFIVDFIDAEKKTERLFERRLDPEANAADRGPQEIELALPHRDGSLVFRTEPGSTRTCDWSVWRDVAFH